jgi:hypothetical protein
VRSPQRLAPTDETGATLVNVWPPRLPEDLRRVVQSDVGEYGFSHVQAVTDGAVLLLSADALVLWRAPEDFTAVPYACVKVRRPRMGKPEVTLQLEPDAPSSEMGDPDAEPPSATCVTYGLDKVLAERVEQLVARHAAAPRASGVRAASVRPAIAEIATEPTRADPPRAEQVDRMEPARDQDALHAAQDVGDQPQPVSSVTWDGIVMSALDPIGYVLRQDLDALVAVQAGHPVGVGARVRATTRVVEGRSRSVVVEDDVAGELPSPEDHA